MPIGKQRAGACTAPHSR